MLKQLRSLMMLTALTPKQYRAIFDAIQGTDEEKIKHILEMYSDRWEWTGGESLIFDMLDDPHITAGDMVDMLAEAIEFQELNQDGKNAYIAIKLALMRRPIHPSDSIKLEPWMDENRKISLEYYDGGTLGRDLFDC
jgi:hypothetical protein